jgi:hypothetical protein
MKLSVMIYLSFLITFMASAIFHPREENGKVYQVKKISEAITITGKGDNPLWKKANQLTDFTYPWETEKPSPTLFKALHNNEWLYCLYEVDDADIKLYVDTNEKHEAVRSDRAEIFFKKDDRMSPYYCLEIDPLARVFDCKGEHYRKLDTNWSWPEGQLIVKADLRKDGYTIEIAISKASLKDLELLHDQTLLAGLFRADCIELKGKEANFRWISWIKPASETPDFHIASAFGKLVLLD